MEKKLGTCVPQNSSEDKFGYWADPNSGPDFEKMVQEFKKENDRNSIQIEISPENLRKLYHYLRLHGLTGVKELPGGLDMVPFFLISAEGLIGQYGEDWIRQNKERLLKELEIVAEM